MIHNLKPYSAYKDSGVSWLGKIPEHWIQLRIKNLFREKDERNGNRNRVLLSLTRTRGIIPQNEASNRLASAEDLSKYKVCYPGDLIMNRMQAWSGMFAVSSYNGLVSPDYSVFTAIGKLNVKYFEHLFKTPVLVDQFAQRSKGIGSGFNRLYTPDFGAVSLVIPPLLEQSAIVHYIDNIDRHIRHHIRAKQKLIKLLEEQKQVIIHQAVTYGLDPNVKLKPSGVEWLGEVPEHWVEVPLKFLSRKIQNGATPPTSDQSFYSDGVVPWFGPSSIGVDIETCTPVRYLSESAFIAGKARLIRGPAILVIIIGATAGRMALLVGEGSTNQQLTAFELREEFIHSEFAVHQLRSSEVWLRSTASTSTIPILNSGIVSRLTIALPPLEEQKIILERLAGVLRPLEAAITGAHREISLLREYRTRLVADVVTGKLDVREAAKNLPEEVEETEISDDSVVEDELENDEMADQTGELEEEVLA